MGWFSKRNENLDSEEVMRNGGAKGHMKEVFNHIDSMPHSHKDHICAGCGEPLTKWGGTWVCFNPDCITNRKKKR